MDVIAIETSLNAGKGFGDVQLPRFIGDNAFVQRGQFRRLRCCSAGLRLSAQVSGCRSIEYVACDDNHHRLMVVLQNSSQQRDSLDKHCCQSGKYIRRRYRQDNDFRLAHAAKVIECIQHKNHERVMKYVNSK